MIKVVVSGFRNYLKKEIYMKKCIKKGWLGLIMQEGIRQEGST